MIKVFLIAMFAIFFSSCAKNQTSITKDVPKEIEIKKVDIIQDELIPNIKEIINLISSGNIDILNSKFVNNEYGIYEFYKDDESKNVTSKHIFKLEELDDYVANFEPINEEIIFNCNSQNDKDYGWSKDGVFFYKKINEQLEQIIKENNLKIEEIYELIITNNIIFSLGKNRSKFS